MRWNNIFKLIFAPQRMWKLIFYCILQLVWEYLCWIISISCKWFHIRYFYLISKNRQNHQNLPNRLIFKWIFVTQKAWKLIFFHILLLLLEYLCLIISFSSKLFYLKCFLKIAKNRQNRQNLPNRSIFQVGTGGV